MAKSLTTALVTTLMLLISTSVANAQMWRNGWDGYRHASTFEEGYLSGLGRYYAGQGSYLESLGLYQNYYQAARSKNILNQKLGVMTRWEIKDEWEKRNPREDWATKRSRQLDLLEKSYEVKKREEELRKKGVLPAKPNNPGFIVQGTHFKNYEEFEGSPEWHQIRKEAKLEKQTHQEKERLAEFDRRKSIEFLRMWDQMSHAEKRRYSELDDHQKYMYRLEWKYPELKTDRLIEEIGTKKY